MFRKFLLKQAEIAGARRPVRVSAGVRLLRDEVSGHERRLRFSRPAAGKVFADWHDSPAYEEQKEQKER